MTAKTDITLFSFRMVTWSIHPESRWFQIASSSKVVFFTALPTISYSEISILIFPSSNDPKTQLFSTSHPVTENKFGHTGVVGKGEAISAF